jgi:cytochrome c oxidase subunit 1
MFGRQVSEFWGKLSFWLIFIGFNVTFFPMHFLGLNGMPRRTFTYDANMGWNTPNFIASIGAFVLGIGMFTYFAVMTYTFFKGKKVSKDPWDARTLEWSLPNPPPEYNFRVIPTVHARDAYWYEKHHRAEIAKEQAEHAKVEAEHGGIHMPNQSIWPFVASVGLLIVGVGATYFESNWTPGIHAKLGTVLFGGIVTFIGIYFWSIEGNAGYHLHLDEHGNPVDEKSAPPAKH